MRASGLLLCCSLTCGLASAGETPHAKVGGLEVTAPAPADYSEVGDRLRTTLFEVMTPATNRLLAAYLPVKALAALEAGNTTGGLPFYAMLQVPRGAEYADCTPEAFDQAVRSIEGAIGAIDTAKTGELSSEMNLRLKSLGVGPVAVDRPEMLGGLFRKTDAAGFAMLMAMKQAEKTSSIAAGMAVLRVKQRVLFAYLYRRYESPETVRTLRTELEAWADAILAANR